MTAPLGSALDLQGAMIAALNDSEVLQGLIGNPPRLYQDVPKDKVFPYVSSGEGQEIDDSASQLDASELFPVLHVWSRTGGFAEGNQIAAAIVTVLNGATLSLAENDFVLMERDRLDRMRDPDGVTKHIAITFRTLINNNQ